MAKHLYKSGEWGGSGESNVYSTPESCGLRVVADCQAEPDYSFDITVMFKDLKTGSLWIARDTGCSCPVPFEDVHSFADMTPVRSEYGIDKFVKENHLTTQSYGPYRVEDVNSFRRKARAAVRKWKS